MKRLMISAFAAVALLAVATTVLWSRSPSPSMGHPVEPAGLMALQELHSGARVNKLPIEDFEDQSLVYSTVAKR
jgi:hypothetical protein